MCFRYFTSPGFVALFSFLFFAASFSACAQDTVNLKNTAQDSAVIWPARTTITHQDAAEYPYLFLKNDSLLAKIYLPDQNKGYYRGTRFNWSGMIGEVHYRGHTFFGKWTHKSHRPEHPEDAIGPIDEFDIQNPPLFATAGVNERFVKIGVGTLIKPTQDAAYKFNQRYAIADTGTWHVSVGDREITFEQKLSYKHIGYAYTKRVVLDKNQLLIHHTLKNTGDSILTSKNYSHNFIRIDGDTAGPNYKVLFGVTPKPEEKHLKRMKDVGATLNGNLLTFSRTYPSSSLSFDLAEPTKSESEKLATITNLRTGAAVAVGSQPAPHRFAFWSQMPLCPEPFVHIRLEPGQETTWMNSYTFTVEKSSPRQ